MAAHLLRRMVLQPTRDLQTEAAQNAPGWTGFRDTTYFGLEPQLWEFSEDVEKLVDVSWVQMMPIAASITSSNQPDHTPHERGLFTPFYRRKGVTEATEASRPPEVHVAVTIAMPLRPWAKSSGVTQYALGLTRTRLSGDARELLSQHAPRTS